MKSDVQLGKWDQLKEKKWLKVRKKRRGEEGEGERSLFDKI